MKIMGRKTDLSKYRELSSQDYLITLLDSNLNKIHDYLISQNVEVSKTEIEKLKNNTPVSSYIAVMRRVKSYRSQIDKQLKEIKEQTSKGKDKVAKFYVEFSDVNIPQIKLDTII